MKLRQRLRSILWRVPVEQEVHDELNHHIELRTRELVESGMAPEAARTAATRRFGDVRRMESQLASMGHRRDRTVAHREWFEELRQDVTFALRQCRLRPGFTLAAVATLALGIGTTTAIFSVVHAVVLRPFPYPDPDRVLFPYTTWRGQLTNTSAGNFSYIRERVTTFEHFSAAARSSFNLADEATEPERVGGLAVTWNYFPTFGVAPLHGRTFTADEDQPGSNRVTVLGYGLWKRRFGGDPTIIGREIRMNGVAHQVIGVMPAAFDELAADGDRLWVPIAFTPDRLAMYDEHYLELYGRRRADVTLAQVNDELVRIVANLAHDHPKFNRERSAAARMASEFVIGDYRTRLFVLLAAVVLVLFIACANVANLLLARLAARSRELAIRAAIGAGRGRIVRQVLTESLVLASLGGLAGLVLAKWGLPLLVSNAPAGIPRLATATLNGQVVATAIGLVLLSTALVGSLPALMMSASKGLSHDLSDGKGSTNAGIRPWIRQTLIASQAALVLIVLAGAALLVRSSINLQSVPIGFDTTGILNARVALPGAQYGDAAQAHGAFRTILQQLQQAPGVELAALDSQPPLLGGNGSNGLIPEGRPDTMDSIVNSRSHFITPDYFRVLRVPIKAGRMFTEQDVRSAPLVMIINETLAREAFAGADPIGKRMSCCERSAGAPSWKTVVGIVADVRSRGPAEPAQPEFYLPVEQIPSVAWSWIGRTMNVVVRSSGPDPAALTGAIRQAVKALDPTLPVYGISTMEEGVRARLAQARFNTMLMTLLGLTGLLLAALGIYSVVAWLVSQRTREIGLRMALGASAGDLVRQVTVHGLKPVSIGLLIGVLVALVTGRLLEGQLFEVGARDPLAIGSVVVLMLIVAIVAGIVPAARAARIDPSRALHEG